MANKTTKYNKCLAHFYKYYRNAGRPDYETFTEWLTHAYLLARPNLFEGDKEMIKHLAWNYSYMLFADINNEALHVFVESNTLKEFLEDTEVKDLSGMEQFLLENGFSRFAVCQKDELPLHTDNISGETKRCFEEAKKSIVEQNPELVESDKGELLFMAKSLVLCIHLPNETEDFSYFFQYNEFGELSVTIYAYGFETLTRLGKDNIDDKVTSLPFNTIAYINAFPGCVRNGLPKGFVFENASGSPKIKISENDVVNRHFEIKRKFHEVSAHFRSGHFRYLKSDYFTNKKGQWVYVNPTVVNNKNAKTVFENTEKATEYDKESYQSL